LVTFGEVPPGLFGDKLKQVFVSPAPHSAFAQDKSYAVFEFLKTRKYSHLIFADLTGLGDIAIQAKRVGLHFQDTQIIVLGLVDRIDEFQGEGTLLTSVHEAASLFMEERSRAQADFLVTPMFAGAVGLRKSRPVIIDPSGQCPVLPSNKNNPEKLSELGVWGHYDNSYGVSSILAVLGQMDDDLTHNLSLRLMFGAPAPLPRSLQRMVRILREKKKFREILVKEQTTFLACAKRQASVKGGVLICLNRSSEFPFEQAVLVRKKIPHFSDWEHLGKNRWKRLTALNNPVILEMALKEILTRNTIAFQHTKHDIGSGSSWADLLRDTPVRTSVKVKSLPAVSVCLTHYNRGLMLKDAVESLYRQAPKNFEVILCDDGSCEPDSLAYLKSLEPEFKKRRWKIFYKTHGYLGAARNYESRRSQNPYLLFLDDDNVMADTCIADFQQAAARTQADAYVCQLKFFQDITRNVIRFVGNMHSPLGGPVSLGVLHNFVGDANCLVKKSSLLKAGGFTEDHGLGHEDIELFNTFLLQGYRVELVPKELVYYRKTEKSMLLVTNPVKNIFRQMRPFLKKYPELRELFFWGVSLSINQHPNQKAKLNLAFYHLVEFASREMGAEDDKKRRALILDLKEKFSEAYPQIVMPRALDENAWQQYIDRYPDLVRGGIQTQNQAFRHYFFSGAREGRVWGSLDGERSSG